MDVGESVEFGRLHNQLYPTLVDVDNTYPVPLMDALRQRGHNVTGSPPFVYLVRPTVRVDNEHSLRYQPRGRGYSGSLKGRRCDMGCVNARTGPVLPKLTAMSNNKPQAIQGRMASQRDIDGSSGREVPTR